MNTVKDIFNDFELEEIAKLKTLERIKQKKNNFLSILIILLGSLVYIIYNIMINFKYGKWDLIILFVLISFLLILFILICSFHVSSYNILIIKYKKINDVKSNPLVNVCKEKIEKCQNLIANKENYYLVQKHYVDLRSFLITYKYLLPTETYINAIKDLEEISSKILHCKLR